MQPHIALVSLVVKEYDEAIDFFVNTLNFTLVEDRFLPDENKRWVLVSPPGSRGCCLLLARAKNEKEHAAIGNQTGGRVFFFLYTDNFDRDYNAMKSKGVEFVREPTQQDYGTVAVFKDLYGSLWDLLQPSA